ncbi:MAG: MBOAT family protein [Lachnospiraceae bacterium]|nr:MBOAT family protein [Lachnospiraceae bacterium]
MVFSSMIFLWMFLPAVLLLYFFAQAKFRNVFLLAVSLIFYAWGEPKYILLMIGSIIVNWFFGMVMDEYGRKKIFLASAVILNLAVLGYFKYFNFFIGIIGDLSGKKIEMPAVTLPIGISFFTFQALSYVIDLYRNQYKAQRNIINLALYISFFPQLIAGPIVKYKDINEQLNNRSVTSEKMAEGIRRFIYGLGKKVIISNTVAQCVDKIYALDYGQLTGILAWVGAILYTLQIYYDFSGYSDMAIGLGKMFGFEFLENFQYPYLSKSIQEFWRRWHISLGTWFREYLYIPLGGNRKGTARTYANLFLVFFMTGLWHGANYTFILWGLYHGLFQIIERAGFGKTLERHKLAAHFYAAVVFIFGWVLFRADNLIQAGVMVKRMIFPWQYTESTLLLGQLFGAKTVLVIICGILGCGFVQEMFQGCKKSFNWKNSYLELGFCTLMFVFSIVMLASNTYNPFIYFRF